MDRSPYNPANEARAAAIVLRTREVAQESVAILKQNPQPNTFLGRKTQEPFPQEETDQAAQ